MKKILCFLLLVFLVNILFAQENREEMKSLLREAKNLLGNYQSVLNRLGSPKTDLVTLSPLADSIAYHYFASPATKVFDDLEPNAKDLLPVYIRDYLKDIALSSRSGIFTNFEICDAKISPSTKISRDSLFSYFEIVVNRTLTGYNQDLKEIKMNGKMSIFISFNTIIENKEGTVKKVYKNLLIRKIEPCMFQADDYISEPSEFVLNFSPTKVHLNSNPTITWKTPRKVGNINIELLEEGKSKPVTLVSNLPLAAQKYKWQVGNTLDVGKNYILKIRNLNDPLCMSTETSPFAAKPKIKKGKWIAIGSTVLVGTLALIFKNQIFPPQEPLLPDVPRNNPK